MANGKKHKHEEDQQSLVALSGGLAAGVPDYLAEEPSEPIRGAENLEQGDFLMPRLSICGKQSPQFDENNERHIEGLKIGQFFNSITREVYGDAVYAVPLIEVKTRGKFRPYGEDGPPLCVSSDGRQGEGDPGGECARCPERQFTRDGKGNSVKPRCTEIMSYAVLLMPDGAEPRTVDVGGKKLLQWSETPRFDSVSVIGFKSTSIGSAKTWNTLLKLRNRDWFAGVYKLTAVAQSDGKNSWHIPMVENAGWQSKAGYDLCLPFYESVKNMFATGRARVDEFAERESGDELPD